MQDSAEVWQKKKKAFHSPPLNKSEKEDCKARAKSQGGVGVCVELPGVDLHHKQNRCEVP